jgi:O-antigen/teichoic acid export membrane protein
MFLGFAAGYLITLVVGGILVLRRLDGIKKPARSHLRSLVDFAKFAWISDIRSKAFNWLDVIILGFFVSSSLIGIYTVAWNIAQFLIIFSSSISQTVFPEMSQISANKNAQATAELFEQATLYAGLVLIPGVIGSVVVGERILRIYGPEFIKGIVVLTILIIANLIQAYQNQILTTLNAVDRPDLAFRVNLVFLLGNLVLNIVLIYFYGWLGAAVATSLSALLSLIAGFAYLRSIISLSLPSMEIMKQWTAAITMGILVYTLQRAENAADLINYNVTTLLALVGIGAIAYFLILAGISEPFRSTIRRNLPITEPNLPW